MRRLGYGHKSKAVSEGSLWGSSVLRSGSDYRLHIGMCAVGKVTGMKESYVDLLYMAFWSGWGFILIGVLVGLTVGKWEILYFLLFPTCIMLFAGGGLLAEKRKKSKEGDKHGRV